MANKILSITHKKLAVWCFSLAIVICIVVILLIFIVFKPNKKFEKKVEWSHFCKCENLKSSPSPRILNGTMVGALDLQFVASIAEIIRADGKITASSVCTGVVITPSFVLTAGHCANRSEEQVAVAGADHDLRTLFTNKIYSSLIKKFTQHPNYTADFNDEYLALYDIAIAELEKPLEFGTKTNIYPACLLGQDVRSFEGLLYFAGYGQQKEEYEHFDPPDQKPNSSARNSELFAASWPANENLSEDQNFNLMMANLMQYRGKQCKLPMLCAWHPSHSICFGDSGGPLMYFNETSNKLYTIGLVSGGDIKLYNSTTQIMCQVGMVTKFTSIYSHLNWIRNQVNESLC